MGTVKFLVTGGTGFIGASVAGNLLEKGIPVVIGDSDPNIEVAQALKGAILEELDVSDEGSIAATFRRHPDITHCVHLAYLMSAEVEQNPPLGVAVNVMGMTHMFEAVLRNKLQRMVFASSETVYGGSQAPYGDRPVAEDDYCAPTDIHFTYGAMKILNEFMADKYVKKHGISLACVRPAIVFGHARKRGSLLWAEDFASKPAVGEPARLPFSADVRDTWIYKDDCAEQLVRLSLKPELKHFAFNNGGTCVSARELAETVRRWVPDAEISFDETVTSSPLIDWQDGRRLIEEIGFTPRSLEDGVRAHINQARAEAGLNPV